ncbi:MAG: DUF3473 domain-containing protein [Verrucomicrobia bacterium]|nr:DUF3473 domain-containing protein [Verrucomicrobiota bacterium]
MLGRKYAVLSMDVEDWYHLLYFDRASCDRSHSLLDGVEVYQELLAPFDIRTTFFVLGELGQQLMRQLVALSDHGHEVAAHGWDHQRPLEMAPETFAADLRRTQRELEDLVQRPILGYRAPCFSLDRRRLDLVQAAGYRYDSSRIQFSAHPLYGTLELDGYQQVSPHTFRHDDFCEFEVSTLTWAGKRIPVSGGGYLRIIPWFLMRRWLERYLRGAELYVLYIHPFELSPQRAPPLPRATSRANRMRFGLGRAQVARRLRQLIELLRQHGFTMTTFGELHRELVASVAAPARS